MDFGPSGTHKVSKTSLEVVRDGNDTPPGKTTPAGLKQAKQAALALAKMLDGMHMDDDNADLEHPAKEPNYSQGGHGAKSRWVQKDYQTWLRQHDVDPIGMTIAAMKDRIKSMC